MSSEQR